MCKKNDKVIDLLKNGRGGYGDVHLQSQHFRLVRENIDGKTEFLITKDLIHDELYESNGGGMHFYNESNIDDLIDLLMHYKNIAGEKSE